LFKKVSQTLLERTREELVERYLGSAAREVPLNRILGSEDVLGRW
jgi:hypothetical protein